MREIKFRAWNEATKEMLPDRTNDNKLYAITALNYPNKYILMQYTGIKDSEGVEIYEGDIVQWLDRDYAHNELIEYDVEKCAFTLGGTYINTKVELSVIGNIYRNPELLNVNA